VVSFLLTFSLISYVHNSTSHFPFMLHAVPSHPPWLDQYYYTWRLVQVMKLLIVQFSPTSCHFISLCSKYSPHHPFLKHPQSMFFPYNRRPGFTYTKNHGKNHSFIYSNFYVFRQLMGWQKFLDWMVLSITRIHVHLFSSWIKFPFITVIPKYWNCATFSKGLLTVFI
jgi:hypothetical protein